MYTYRIIYLVVSRATEDHGDIGLVQRHRRILREDSCLGPWCVEESVRNLQTSDMSSDRSKPCKLMTLRRLHGFRHAV